MAEAGEKAIRKKEREPIATVCLVVLLIASVAVLGVFINDNYISKNKETVEYGDSIELNYTGSLYAYYNDKSTYTPVIFDTSVESVGKDTGNVFIASFNKTSYATSTIKLDSATSGNNTDFLKAFEDACVGHKVGDTFSFKIDKADAYKTGIPCAETTASMSIANNFKLDVDAYNKLFNDNLTSIPAASFSRNDVNGLQAHIVGTEGGTNATIMYDMDLGEYTIYEKAGIGKVVLNVTAVGANVEFTLNISEQKEIADQKAYGTNIQAIEMISLNLFGHYYNIVGYNGTDIAYNTGSTTNAAISDMDLYFVVTIVKKA
jgi:hypothetical protein